MEKENVSVGIHHTIFQHDCYKINTLLQFRDEFFYNSVVHLSCHLPQLSTFTTSLTFSLSEKCVPFSGPLAW